MRKSVLYIAVAGAACLPFTASAQASEVTIYGTFLPFADNIRTTGATAPGLSPATGGASLVSAAAYTGINLPARNRVTSGTSNLGFKGDYRINEDLKVFWQVESAVSPDGDAPNALTSRNSAVGLKGSWGTVFFGSWDTPYKYPILFVGALRGLNPFDNAITANPGFNVPGTTTQTGRANSKADASFNRRQGNSLQYWTPTWNGFSARIAYSAGEGKTVASATSASVTPDLWSALVTYQKGPFGISYAHERHNDYFGLAQMGGSAAATLTNTTSKDDGDELVAHYTFPTGTKLSVIAERLAYNTTDSVVGNVNSYERDAWYALVQQKLGAHQLWASLGSAGAGKTTRTGGAPASSDGLGGRQWTVGYSYALAKCADLYASYYCMTNDRSASYALFPPAGTVAPGADTKGFGMGLLYTF
ncbi:porin [Mesoterricola silvestris]|uniref:Porin domain-containing protein n=1 Tax=Mesoterricola silvestris TaxID=2927979 RepID=A0AA48K893_9BACT|nr:porin [Mesoterricola silvestris]BDU72694.1 hypothetical protein METEAL_18680 [Mesoterricola silvestris]